MDILFKDLEEDENMQDWEKIRFIVMRVIRRIKTVWMGRVRKHPQGKCLTTSSPN